MDCSFCYRTTPQERAKSPDKLDVELTELKAKHDLADEEIAYVADDVIDLPVMRRVGLPVAVADAAVEVLAAATRVPIRPGGHGAVREAVEFILHAQGKWNETLKSRFGL